MTAPAAPLDLRRDLVALLPRLRRFALTLAASSEAADDMVREACLLAVSKGRCAEADDRLEAWLFRLLATRSRELGRNPRHDAAYSVDVQTLGNTRPVANQALVTDMPSDLASVFLLVEVENLSYALAADILTLSPEDLTSRLCAARLHFADMHPPLIERRA